MPQPTSVVNRLDLGISIDAFNTRQNRDGYIAHNVLPLLPRSKPEGTFPKFNLTELLQTRTVTRTENGDYPRSEMVWAQDTYTTTEKGHESHLDDRLVARYGDIVDAEFYESERITNIVLQNYEKEIADYLFNATTFTGKTTAVTNEWDDAANATPIDDVNAARELIFTASGHEPNALVVNRHVMRSLQNCTQILDRLKYQPFQDARQGAITPQMLATSLDLDQVIVAGAAYNSANPAAAASISRLWSNEFALLCKVAESPNPSEPCLGRTVVWTEEAGIDGDMLAVITEQYRENRVRGDIIRVRTDWGRKELFLEMGHLLSNITT